MAKTTPKPIQAKDKLLPKFSLFFFKKPALASVMWLLVVVFGIASYTTFLKREGFPTINIPLIIVSGSYAVDDPAQVDSTLGAPIAQAALTQKDVTTVEADSEGNFFTAVIQYKEDVDAHQAQKALEQKINSTVKLPSGARLTYSVPYFGAIGPSTKKLDDAISIYATQPGVSLEQLTAKAHAAVTFLNKQKLAQVDNFFVQSPFEDVTNPATGQKSSIQHTFDRYGKRADNRTSFSQSVIIGAASAKGSDAIKLDKEIQGALDKLQTQPEFKDFHVAISASSAPSIKESISELQSVLLEGLVAVLVIGSIVIAVRASFITVISMITVLATTIGLLYLIGYSLNVITLFALILGLSLVVDDTIIMVEAIDASRKREKNARDVIHEATRKISRAMVAATTTAALSFTPLLFVGGILGSFIRAIPVTIISALLISLLVALVFIPLFSRFLLLGKKQLGEDNVREIAAGFEHKVAVWLGRPMLWAKHHRKREFTVGISAVLVGLAFIAAAGFIFSKVTFNIFPPSKDTNQLAISLTFPSGTTVPQAEAVAKRADDLTSKTLGRYFIDASYYGQASAQSAVLSINIMPYTERSITAPDLVKQLDSSFKNFKGAKVDAYQLDVGPPTSAFTVNIDATNRGQAQKLADDMAAYLKGHRLTRVSGTQATIVESTVDNTNVFKRIGKEDDVKKEPNGKEVIGVTSTFDGTDTTTLTTLAQDAVKKEFNAKKIASYGLKPSVVSFDLGEEQENQDSFKTLGLAFPVLLVVIFLLLAIQFRSLLQPLLIFMAIPFSLFGVTLGLFLTDNAFSFFAMLGFFALIGLSIKNTILLTDYANQARRAGMGPIDAAVAALGERFRPLVATSITAICSLIPLAVTSPFWQGLAVVLIFGLASSTLLVLTVFPYYYLGAEYLRMRISRLGFLKWLVPNIVLAAALIALKQGKLALPLLLVFNLAWLVGHIVGKRTPKVGNKKAK